MVRFYHSNRDSVKAEPVAIKGSSGAYIQWLVTNDHGSKRYALRRFSIHPGGRIALHKHPYEETVYIVSGNAEVFADDRKVGLAEGEFAYIDGDVPHAISNPGDSILEFLCIIPYLDNMAITPLES